MISACLVQCDIAYSIALEALTPYTEHLASTLDPDLHLVHAGAQYCACPYSRIPSQDSGKPCGTSGYHRHARVRHSASPALSTP